MFFGVKTYLLIENVSFIGGGVNQSITIRDSVWIEMDTCFVCPSREVGMSELRVGKLII